MNFKLKDLSGLALALAFSAFGCKKAEYSMSQKGGMPPLTSSAQNTSSTIDAAKQERSILFQKVIESLDRQVKVLESKIKQTNKLKTDTDFQEYLIEKIYWVKFTLEVPYRPKITARTNTPTEDLADPNDINGFEKYWEQIDKLENRFKEVKSKYYKIVPSEKADKLLNKKFISTIKSRIYKRFGVK